MQINTREFYASTNGDRWFLRHELESGHVYVKHVANRSAGGQQTDFEVDAFLHRSTGSPEREALVRLIATLADKHQDI
jgi:hypothetical protein